MLDDSSVDMAAARVLVIDDDAVTRRLLRKSLEYAGYVVDEAADGVEGVQAFERTRPDIVLLDVLMPRMNGFEACAAIRALPCGENVPVLVFTGHDDTDSIKSAYEVGATSFVSKPVNFLNLTYRIRYIIRSKQIADKLRDREVQLNRAQRIAKIGYWEWSSQPSLITLSDGVCETFGLPPGQASLTIPQFLRLVHPDDRKSVVKSIARGAKNHKTVPVEYRIRRPDGTCGVIYQDSEIFESEQAGTYRVVGICQDVTERCDAETRIRFLAHFDPITRLPNRTLFKDRLARALAEAERNDRLVAILLLDLDHFKHVNDTVGFEGGNQILNELAKRLVCCLGAEGQPVTSDAAQELAGIKISGDEAISHPGGDEFLILLSDLRQPEEGAKIAQNVVESVTQPFHVAGQEISMSGSVGISVYPIDGRTPDQLLKNAEAAMYHAKEGGRSGYQFFTVAMNERARRRFSLETVLRGALARDEFELHFQPQVDLVQQRIVGVEALLRLHVPDIGFIPPGDFIPVAEETGLILPLGQWVLVEAARWASAWKASGLPGVRIAVNLSAAQLKQPNFAQSVEDILKTAGVDPSYFEVELTESMLLDNTGACTAVLNQLAELGLTIAIDDFGTGYSSLTYLRRFPLSALKIDRSFVHDVGWDPDDASIVNAVIALAHSLRLRVIAEGVEDSIQLAFLQARKCEEAQGYLFCRPLPADSIRDLLQEDAVKGGNFAPSQIA